MAAFALVTVGITAFLFNRAEASRIKRTALAFEAYKANIRKRAPIRAALKKEIGKLKKKKGANNSVKLSRLWDELRSLHRASDRDMTNFENEARRINQ